MEIERLHGVLKKECELIVDWAKMLQRNVIYNYDEELIDIDIAVLKETIKGFEHWDARYREERRYEN